MWRTLPTASSPHASTNISSPRTMNLSSRMGLGPCELSVEAERPTSETARRDPTIVIKPQTTLGLDQMSL